MSLNPPTASLRRIKREHLWDRAYEELRDALLAGRFEPGQSLTLRFLAETFGTSITPVRDAVTRLIAQGVLQQGPRNAAVVLNLRAGELRDLTIVRCELEGRAAREAALRPDAATLRRLQGRLEIMRRLIARGEFSTYLDTHRAFHFDIYAMARIPVLREMIENVWLRCGPALSFVVPDHVLSLRGAGHHTALLDAIAKGDAARAEAAIVADIEEAMAYLMGLADPNGRLTRPMSPISEQRQTHS